MSAPNRDSVRRDLVAYLQSIARPGADFTRVADDTNLVDAGLLDSLAVVEIIQHLEQEYGARIRDGGFDPRELGSFAGMLRIIGVGPE